MLNGKQIQDLSISYDKLNTTEDFNVDGYSIIGLDGLEFGNGIVNPINDINFYNNTNIQYRIRYDGTPNSLTLTYVPTATTIINIDDNNIGIGGNATANKLEVYGNLKVNGNLISNDGVTTSFLAGEGADLIDNTEIECVVIGYNAYADRDYSTVIGSNTFSASIDSVIIGDNAYVTGSAGGNVVIGSGAQGESLTETILMGKFAYTESDYSVVLGANTDIYGQRNVYIGNDNVNDTFDSTIGIGSGIVVSEANIMQIGSNRQLLNLSAKSGLFTFGEIITGGTSGATGITTSNAFNNALNVRLLTATNFINGENISGATSLSTGTISTVVTYNNPINKLQFNRGIETITFPNSLDMSNNLGNIDRLNIRGRLTIESSSNTTAIAYFGHPGFNGMRLGGVSQGITFDVSNGISGATVASMGVFHANSSAATSTVEWGTGLDRSARLTKSSGTLNAIVGLGRDQSITATNRSLVRVANRNPTASLNLNSGVNYFEVIDYNTTTATKTEIFTIDNNRRTNIYGTANIQKTFTTNNEVIFNVSGNTDSLNSGTYNGQQNYFTSGNGGQTTPISTLRGQLNTIELNSSNANINNGIALELESFDAASGILQNSKGLHINYINATTNTGYLNATATGIDINQIETYDNGPAGNSDVYGAFIGRGFIFNGTSSGNVYGARISNVEFAGTTGNAYGLYIDNVINSDVNGDSFALYVDGNTNLTGDLIVQETISGKLPYEAVSTSTTIVRLPGKVVEQTASGITTDLWASPQTGDTIIIINDSGNTNTVDGNGVNIEGLASQNILHTERFHLFYNGTEWKLI